MKMQLLHKLNEYSVPIKDLVLIYILYIRSVCEQSAVVWHSSLSAENRADLERVQKTALKIILQDDYISYDSALQKTDLQTLDERREILCLKFAKTCLKHDDMKNIFPVNHNLSSAVTRNPAKFKVHHANTERLKNSSIIHMQNLLNEDDRKRRQDKE